MFSPPFTNDEDKDSKIQKRIRQLSWINAKHLLCSIDEVNSEVRDLVYNAISGKKKYKLVISGIINYANEYF